MITAKPNVIGNRSIIGKEFKTKAEAKRFIKKLNTPGKIRTINLGGKKKKIRLTSFRQGISGTGINNPRIIKRKVLR